MQIGTVAARSGVSTKTLRYYEQIGLLSPAARTASGYRQYGEDVLDRLAFIRAAQAIGLTLGEIRSIIALRDRGETPCEHVVDLLRTRADDIARTITDLKALQRELDRVLTRAGRLDPAHCAPRRVCHLIG